MTLQASGRAKASHPKAQSCASSFPTFCNRRSPNSRGRHTGLRWSSAGHAAFGGRSLTWEPRWTLCTSYVRCEDRPFIKVASLHVRCWLVTPRHSVGAPPSQSSCHPPPLRAALFGGFFSFNCTAPQLIPVWYSSALREKIIWTCNCFQNRAHWKSCRPFPQSSQFGPRLSLPSGKLTFHVSFLTRQGDQLVLPLIP